MSDALSIAHADRLEERDCLRLMLGSEPWATLGYGEAEIAAIARSAGDGNILVCAAGGEVVGFALSSPGVLLGEYLRVLAVARERRGTGVGRRLMEGLEQSAFARWPNVYLCVSDFNAPARAFYRRLGYAEVGALDGLLTADAAEILMRKSIGAWRDFRRATQRSS